MRKIIIVLFFSAICILVGCQENNESQLETEKATEKQAAEVEKLFEDWSKDDIQEVIMTGEPSIEISFSEEQIEEFVKILNAIVIYEEVSPVDLDGHIYHYRITKEDGSVTVLELNSYFIIDGAWYETAYEPCEEMGQFSNEVAGLEW